MSMLIGWEILAKHWTMYKDFESTLKIDQVRKEKTETIVSTHAAPYRPKRKTGHPTN
jgi:hypothetical protein